MAQVANTTVRGAMAATADTTPTYKYRRASTAYSTVSLMVYTGSAWVGTIAIQISDPDRNSWVTIDSWTADDFKTFTPPSDCDIRMYFTRISGTPIGAIINNA